MGIANLHAGIVLLRISSPTDVVLFYKPDVKYFVQ